MRNQADKVTGEKAKYKGQDVSSSGKIQLKPGQTKKFCLLLLLKKGQENGDVDVSL